MLRVKSEKSAEEIPLLSLLPPTLVDTISILGAKSELVCLPLVSSKYSTLPQATSSATSLVTARQRGLPSPILARRTCVLTWLAPLSSRPFSSTLGPPSSVHTPVRMRSKNLGCVFGRDNCVNRVSTTFHSALLHYLSAYGCLALLPQIRYYTIRATTRLTNRIEYKR